MKKGDDIIFLRERFYHSPTQDFIPHKMILEEIPAVYLGDSPSDDICFICHEPREGHDRRGRVHAFEYWDEATRGADIEVHYPLDSDGVEIRHHVQQGETANCWKEK